MIEADRKAYLDSLRGIAALSVVILHLDIGSLLNGHFTQNVWVMVDFFFVLSGYVIALNYSEKLHSLKDLYVFQVKRFARLYPLHLLTLVLFVGLECVKYLAVSFGIKMSSVPFEGRYSPSAIVENVFLIQNFTPTGVSWNLPSWSISAEFYTYLLFAGLLICLRNYVALKWLVTALLIGASAVYTYHYGLDKVHNGYIRCVYSFLLGMCVFALEKRVSMRFHVMVPFLMLLATAVGVSLIHEIPERFWMLFPFVFCALIFVLNGSDPKGLPVRVLNHRVLVYLGAISYGIYMIHHLVWRVFGILATFLFGVPVIEDTHGELRYDLQLGVLSLTAIHLVGIAFIILLAHLSYRYFEEPMKRWITGRLVYQLKERA